MGMGQSLSERISLQALCTSLHIWAPQTVAVSQYEASAPAIFVRVASPQYTTNFYYFQLFSIRNDMQIWNDHHASPPKGSKNKGTLRIPSELFDLHCCVRTFLSLWQHHIMA
jgi:hypothetical protein